MTNSLAEKFDNYGYCIGNPVLNKNKISELRFKLEQEFKLKSFPKVLDLFELEDKRLINSILEIYSSSALNSFISELSGFYKEEIYFVPKFIIQRNYHVDRLFSPRVGWHRDCGEEFKLDYCKKKLATSSYVFGKLGIYLQENSEYGGSIDVIPSSHTRIKKNNILMRKIKEFGLYLIAGLQKNFIFLYKLIPEKLFKKILNGKSLHPDPGCFVLFDSRIIHRGTPISDKVRKEVNFSSQNYSAELHDKNKTKYSFYVDLANKTGFDNFIYERSRRFDSNQGKITAEDCLKAIKKIKTFSPMISAKIEKIFLETIKYHNR